MSAPKGTPAHTRERMLRFSGKQEAFSGPQEKKVKLGLCSSAGSKKSKRGEEPFISWREKGGRAILRLFEKRGLMGSVSTRGMRRRWQVVGTSPGRKKKKRMLVRDIKGKRGEGGGNREMQ